MNNNPHRHREPHDGEAPQFFEPILEYYWNLPVITRTWFSLSLLVTTLNTLDLFPEHQLIFIWDRVQPPYLELWRIVTAFTWAGPGTLADFQVLMLLYAMVLSVSSYETNPHETGQRSRRLNRHETKSDCLFALICCSILIVGTYLVVTETAYLDHFLYSLGLDEIWLQPLFTRTLEYSMLTLDSFRNPDRTVNINFFPIQGRYVPLFHIGFAIMMGYRTIEIFHGILVATIYLMLIKRVIFKPQCLMQILGEELEEENDQQHMMPEEGGNILHRAAASNDLPVIHGKLRQLESVSPVNMAVATALFRQRVSVNLFVQFNNYIRFMMNKFVAKRMKMDGNRCTRQQEVVTLTF